MSDIDLGSTSIMDSFNDQLTLGLLNSLVNTPGVRNVVINQSLPCDKVKISQWEQRNACLLPNDLKSFYASRDGFKLTWSYKLEGNQSNLSIGNITVNPLLDLVRLCDIKSDSVNINVMRDLQMLDKLSNENTPNFTKNSKIFELDSSLDVGHICLVYLDNQVEVEAASFSNQISGNEEQCLDYLHEEPSKASIWLLDTSYCWHFLAPNFSNYFRKALVHMGLPHWQFKFTDLGLTSTSEFFMNLIAPHLSLTERVPVIEQLDDDENLSTGTIQQNQFDPNIFKITSKTSKSKKNLSSKNTNLN